MSRTVPRSVVAMAHVQSVTKSIEFYAKLGFQVGNTFQHPSSPELSWAWLTSKAGADLMIARATGPIDPEQQAVLFYVYVDDVAAKRDELIAAGIECGPIAYPFYAQRGEFFIKDLDGYGLSIMHT